MTGKRAKDVMLEIRAYIKGRTLLGIKHVDIHREVCDIYGEGEMSHRSICRWVAKFKTGQQQVKDTTRSGHPAKTTHSSTKKHNGNSKVLQKCCSESPAKNATAQAQESSTSGFCMIIPPLIKLGL